MDKFRIGEITVHRIDGKGPFLPRSICSADFSRAVGSRTRLSSSPTSSGSRIASSMPSCRVGCSIREPNEFCSIPERAMTRSGPAFHYSAIYKLTSLGG